MLHQELKITDLSKGWTSHDVTCLCTPLHPFNFLLEPACSEDEPFCLTMQSYILNSIRDLMADPQAQKSLLYVSVVGFVCLIIGYFIGESISGGLFDPSTETMNDESRTKRSWPNSYDVTVHADSSDEESGADSDEQDEDADGDGRELKSFENTADEVKLVLVVRTDLNMGKGV